MNTTQINVFELVQGIFAYSKKIEDELFGFNLLLQKINVLDVNFAASYTAGKLSKKGINITTGNLLIAGTALANNDTKIVTKNRKDFSRIPGIKVETY